MNLINVMLAEDHTIVREGFRWMLEMDAGVKVVGEAPDGRQAVLLAKKLRPHVVLMDIAMPLLNGVEATRQLLQDVPTSKVLILSAHCDDAYVNQAIASGAKGFLLKQTSAHDVCRAIREVQNGNTYFSPLIARRRARRARQAMGNNASLLSNPDLTSREREVLQLIAEGKTNKEMAAELGIVIKTIEKHRQNLMEKLDIHDTAGLTRYAISTGVIENRVQATIV